MAINFGTGNASRYYSVPDHADFSLPNGDWSWITTAYFPGGQTTANAYYLISTNTFQAANSFNLFVSSGTQKPAIAVNTGAVLEAAASLIPTDKWMVYYAARRSNFVYVGQCATDSSLVIESVPQALSAASNGTSLHIGSRNDLNTSRFWQGRLGYAAFVPGYGVTTNDVLALAQGTPLLSMPFVPNIRFLLHGRTADATIRELVGGHVATRSGTGYGTNEEEILSPYPRHLIYLRGSTGTAVTEINLTIANSTQDNGAGTGSITQDVALAPASLTQENLASDSAIILGAAVMLAASHASQDNAAGTVTITQEHVLVHAPSVQDNLAAESSVVQEQILTAANATQGNTASTGAITLISIHNLAVDPVTQGNTAGTGQITRTQTLTAASAIQVNRASTGAWSAGIVFEEALATATSDTEGIKKPGIPADTPAWLRTTLETILGRRNNRIEVPEQQNLTFSSTPTQAEMESLYAYTNSVRDSLEKLINRLDS